MPRPPTGPTCAFPQCGQPAVQSWRRLISADGTDETLGFACATHQLDPDHAALLHAADCPAPGQPCTCPEAS